MSFVKRKLRYTFRLGEGQFGTAGTDQAVLPDTLRSSARIIKAGGPSMSTAQLLIYGMSLSLMNKLSTLGMLITLVRKNSVLVEAGDDQNGFSAVFVGTILNAWAELSQQPIVPFHVEAFTGALEAVQPVKPTSFTGPTDVASIMSGLATQMGLKFENSGVQTKLRNPYFWGSPRDQVTQCVEAAGLRGSWIIDNGTLAIWKPGAARGAQSPEISPTTGLQGYPTYTSKGVQFVTTYNPSIGYGSKVNIKSSQEPANGEWVVYKMDYDLEANSPGGKWSSTIEAARPGLVVVA